MPLRQNPTVWWNWISDFCNDCNINITNIASLNIKTFREAYWKDIRNIRWWNLNYYELLIEVIFYLLLGENYKPILKKQQKLIWENPSDWICMLSRWKEDTYPWDTVHKSILDISWDDIDVLRNWDIFLIPDTSTESWLNVFLYFLDPSIGLPDPDKYSEAVSRILFWYKYPDDIRILLSPSFRKFSDKYPNHPAVRSAIKS